MIANRRINSLGAIRMSIGIALAGAWMLSLSATNVFAGQITPSSRTFVSAWNSSGYDGTIPNPVGRSVKDFGAVGDGVTDDRTAIINTINWVNSTPGAGMVWFPAGTYKFGSTISLPANIVLRGETDANGNPLATLQHDQGGAWAHSINISGSRSGTWQAMQPAAIHATQITVTDGSVFSPGDYAEIQQANDPAWDNGDVWAANARGQIIKITAVNGNVLTLEHGLRCAFEAQWNPEIQKIIPKQNVGIENLKIERVDATEPSGGSTIEFSLAANCWVRGCELNHCRQRHVEMQYSTKISITGNYIHHAYYYGGGGSAYGVECVFHTGECLIENNIFRYLRHAMLLQGGPNGNVYGYNYSREATRTEWPSDYAADICFHGNRPYANLFEGNIACFAWLDNSHGQAAGPYNMLFRNATTVRGILMSSTSPQSDSQNFVGNDPRSYSLAGSDHFQHGNRVGTSSYTITPSGTDYLDDYSYYLSLDPETAVTPAWWTIAAAIPTIGPDATLPFQQFNNPAKARWDAAGTLVVGNDGPVIMWDTGAIQATIDPQDAINDGAQWRISGGAWQNSGVTIYGLSAGDYTVQYSDEPDWITPNDQTVTVVANQTSTTTGIYTLATGAIQATIEPQDAINDGAQWRVNDGAWQNSGAIVSNLYVGQYTVQYNNLVDWTTPDDQLVNVLKNQTTQTIGTYIAAGQVPPTCAITSPSDGADFVEGDNITITATASDADGTVSKVEFFQGLTKLGEDTSAPYSYTWQNAPIGNFTLTAKATDNDNITTTSDPVGITVAANTPPTCAITSPSNGADFTEGDDITINATASDADGTVSKVEFFQGSSKLGEDTSSPYSYTWQNVSAGNYTLTAKATDNKSATTTSSPIGISVEESGGFGLEILGLIMALHFIGKGKKEC